MHQKQVGKLSVRNIDRRSMISSRTSTAVEYTRTDGDKRVLAKAVRDNCTLIIITPAWPFQPWYTQLLRMSIQDPIFTPPFPNVLTYPNQN